MNMQSLKYTVASLALIGGFGCGSKSDAPTAASTTPASSEGHHDHAEGHHGEGHHGHAEGHHDHAEGHHGHGASETDAAVVPPGEASIGDTTTCMVSGETFVVSDSSPKVEHEGKTYYFCCAGCAGKFEKEPGKFLKTTESAS